MIVDHPHDETLPAILPDTGQVPLFYSILEQLPAGIRFDPATRRLHGTPTEQADRAEYTYQVRDSSRPNRFAFIKFDIEVFEDTVPQLQGSVNDQVFYVDEEAVVPLPSATSVNLPITYELLPTGLAALPSLSLIHI